MALTDPGQHLVAITPSDTADIHLTRGVYVGATGDLAVISAFAETVTLVAVPAGSLLPIQITRVKLTGTTASSIVGIY